MAKREARFPGFLWVNPYLTVKDPGASIAFYQKAFGFSLGNALKNASGVIEHAEMKYQDATIMFGPEGAMGGAAKTPAHSKVEPATSLYVYCEDVDALLKQAKAAGAQVISEPENMFYGDRMAQVKDPDGHVWSLATNVADFDPSKAPQGQAAA